MSLFAAVRSAARVGPARLVAGMRVNAASSPTRSARLALPTNATRAFSVSSARLGSGSSDQALSAKLQEELQYEKKELEAQDATPEFLKTFTEQGVWAIEDVRGNDEVTLKRKFGDENIRLMFSIADVGPEEEFENENEEDEDESTSGPLPIRVSASITKSSGPGAMNIDMMVSDGAFTVENISFYEDATVGTSLTADADWTRRGLYIGPQFETLDLSVQDAFDAFIAERGINESVAFFIPEYAAHKEQQEYFKWLGKVKNFIDL
ncbi:hypothetical protein D9619_007729 [Psilocybe cf. subviscida]|uniref:Mitochondrial glyco protein n=1 Tax=Psilocybe cf. subviscida TaxID=2480587 RepID=A0A8H5ESF1_9AGAR|nr:hypothetical protein D9619_007729 [Psilocybe cf. subviscida]